ncbi:unnamed protein product [Ilex paraguariensis]|uniref:Mannan endo-1,4-beta-mannosidase n=1 Tax=Ilex paraguariensis TaxID=185542 RepID=A0ABC8SDJ2_9AQUA
MLESKSGRCNEAQPQMSCTVISQFKIIGVGNVCLCMSSGTQFVLNGSPFLFNGFNSYWMMNVATNPSDRFKVSEVFRDAAVAGLSVCRTWAFADGGDKALQISPGT